MADQTWQDADMAQEVLYRDTGGPLRVYHGPEGDDDRPRGLSPAMTLPEFYRDFYRPIVEGPCGNSDDTQRQNQRAVRLWARLTANRSLAEIDQFECAAFVAGLGRLAEIGSQTTINKHAAAVQKVLRYAGPPVGREWRAANLIARVPYVERPPKEQVRLQEPYTLEELELLVANTQLLKWPSKLAVPAEVYWRGLFVLLYNTGLRIQETILLEWRDVQADELRIRNRNRKGGRKGHVVALTPMAQTALEWLRPADSVRVFPVPASFKSKGWFFRDFRAYRRQLLSPERVEIAFHGFRRLHNVELARINERACAASLGHGAAVNAQAYCNRELVRESVGKFRQPRLTSTKQLELF